MRKRQNTARIKQKKQRICAKNWPTYYIDRHVAWFWTMKDILLMVAQICKEMTTNTRMTNLYVQIEFALHENVKFVPKENNPPNIENFWGCLAQKVYEKARSIESKIKVFDTTFVESLLEGVKAKVRSKGDNCVYALFK